jgi:hypothetical protein
MAGTYPVSWKSQTYTLSDLTVGHKEDFCSWLIDHLIEQAERRLRKRPDLLQDQITAIMGGQVWWGDAVMSAAVAHSLSSEAGALKLNRLLFGDSVKGLSDADLAALIDAKEADPASDYMVAMKRLRGGSDPKAPTPGTGPDPAAETLTTASS